MLFSVIGGFDHSGRRKGAVKSFGVRPVKRSVDCVVRGWLKNVETREATSRRLPAVRYRLKMKNRTGKRCRATLATALQKGAHLDGGLGGYQQASKVRKPSAKLICSLASFGNGVSNCNAVSRYACHRSPKDKHSLDADQTLAQTLHVRATASSAPQSMQNGRTLFE